jgi:Tfp pilus assembly protein PilF
MIAILQSPVTPEQQLSLEFPTEAQRVPEIAEIKSWCLARADEWHACGEMGIARNFLNHAAMTDPSDAQVWIALGSLQYELGELEKAGVAFHKAGELEPTNSRIFLHLGLVHQKLNQQDEAEALLNHAVTLEPNNALAMSLLGNLLMEQKRYASASIQFINALQHRTNNLDLLLKAGFCSFKVNDHDSARRFFERVLELSPGHEIAMENLTVLNKVPSNN